MKEIEELKRKLEACNKMCKEKDDEIDSLKKQLKDILEGGKNSETENIKKIAELTELLRKCREERTKLQEEKETLIQQHQEKVAELEKIIEELKKQVKECQCEKYKNRIAELEAQ